MAIKFATPRGFQFRAGSGRRSIPRDLDLRERCSIIDTFNTLGAGQTYLNPDDLVRRKGLAVYEYMSRDDQVHAVLTLKKHARLSTGWEILPASGDPDDMKIAQFVRYVFEVMSGSLDQKIYEIMSALQYGFSLTEKLWMQYKEGPWKGYVGYKNLKTRSPFCFEFFALPTGQSEEYDFGIKLVDVMQKVDETIPNSKMVHYPYNADFSNPYGHSDLRAAYRSWFSKDFTFRFMNIYIEKNAVPPILFEIPDTVDGPEITRLKLFAKNWQTQTSGTIPTGVKPIIPESKFGGALSFKFQEIIELHNTAIARAILIPDLLGFSSRAKGGSLGASKHQTGIFFFVLDKMGQDLEEMVFGEQIIKPLVDYNFPNVQNYPRFRFKPLEQENSEARARIVQMMVASGVLQPDEPWIRPYLALPNESLLDVSKDRVYTAMHRLFTEDGVKLRTLTCGKCAEAVDVDFVMFERQVPYHPGCFKTLQSIAGEWFEGGKVENVRLQEKGPNVIEPVAPSKPKAPPAQFVSKLQNKKGDLKPDEFRREFTEFEVGMPFQDVQKTLNDLDTNALTASDRIFTKIKQTLERDIDRYKILAGKPENLSRLKVNIGPYRKLVLNTLMSGAVNGQYFVAKEVQRRASRYGYEVQDGGARPLTEPQPQGAATRHFRGVRIAREGASLRVGLTPELSDFLDRRAFRVAGTESQRILDGVKGLLENQIKQNNSGDLKRLLGDLFDGWISLSGRFQSGAWRSRMVLRIAVMEGFNEGRRELYLDPLFSDILQGFQWSSVIDGLTSKYCIEMDQKVFKVDEIVGYFPPAHPFCRSVLIPVFTDDEFSYTDTSPVSPRAGTKRPAMFTDAECDRVLYTEAERNHIYGD